jgi:transcriptional regulator with XRE-family HTH domain
MQLRAYAREHRLTAVQLAKMLDYPTATVRKWLQRERIPRPEALRKIEEATGGQVAPADFFESPSPPLAHVEART